MKALVLGGDARTGLSVIRSLGRAGIEVHVGWHEPGGVAQASRYISKLHRLRRYGESPPDSWKGELVSLMQGEAFDLVIPCHEDAVWPLQKYRKDLEVFGHIYLLDDVVFETVYDKLRTTAMARSLSIPVPREIRLDSREQIRIVPCRMRLPIVLKPRSSYDLNCLKSKRMVKTVFTWEDYESLAMEMLAGGAIAAQEYVSGHGVGVELLLRSGEPLSIFQHLRLHEPVHGGAASYRKSVPVDRELKEAALKLLGHLRYTGVAMVEFRVNPDSGQWVLLEVNGRFWGSLPLAVACGADFPANLFALLTRGQSPPSSDYRIGLYCRNWFGDLSWLRVNVFSLPPRRAFIELARFAAQALINCLALRERSDTLTWDDPAPAAAELTQIVREIVGRIINTVAAWFMGRSFLRSRRARDCFRAVEKAGTILFVCKGNIYRSPFAEHLARRSWGTSKSYRSAGYYPEEGRACPPRAIAAARRWGIDLEGHRSKTLTAELLDGADAVLVFDYENYKRALNEFQADPAKVFPLGALDPAGPLFIQDPWGKDIADVERIYGQIANIMSGINRVHLPLQAEPCPQAKL